MRASVLAVATMAAVHEQVDQWACRENEVREDAKQVRPVFSPQKERRNAQKEAQAERRSRTERPSIRLLIRRHR
jgi:hypothetical protein